MSRGVALLPVTTLRLAGRHVVPLTLWFSLGYLARYVLTRVGVAVSHGDHEQLRRVAATLILTALITVTLATVIGMFGAVRGLREEPLIDVVGRALFPFVVIYLAWGMYLADVRAFSRADVEHNLDSAAHGSVAGRALYVTDLWLALAATVIAWLVRLVLERHKERRAAGPVLAYFETAFNLFAISSVFLLLNRATGWVTSRRIWPHGSIPYADILGFAFDTLTLPLVWFAMAAVVYDLGTETGDHRAAFDGTRLYRVAEANARRSVLTRLTAGQRERWVPLVHAIRLVLRAGAPALGLLCLCYVMVDVAVAYGFRGALYAIGPDHDPAAWRPILVPLEFVRELVRNVLHVALLAAAVGLVREVTEETGAPEPDAVPV